MYTGSQPNLLQQLDKKALLLFPIANLLVSRGVLVACIAIERTICVPASKSLTILRYERVTGQQTSRRSSHSFVSLTKMHIARS